MRRWTDCEKIERLAESNFVDLEFGGDEFDRRG